MPTEAFYKLDNTKKEQILAAAIKEFSELPYSKVSIFKIAQNAGVSRSGFYYYFKDKKDVYEYILNEIKDEFVDKYKVTQVSEIDLFWLTEMIFDYIANVRGTKRESLFLQIMSNMTPEYLKGFFVNNDTKDCPMSAEITLKLDNLKLTSIQELKSLVFLLANCIVYSVMQYFESNEPLEEGKQKLYQMFEIIKYGALKGE